MWACWPKIKPWMSFIERLTVKILNYCLDRISPHFLQASCEKHDQGYKEWWDEARRKVCDLKFHQAICNDIYWLKVNTITLFWYLLLATIFYLAVRKLWYRYFVYKTQ